jgi:lipopolysaccharide/colanic/teichoic acid biosynthesis glycosyltransferase
VNTKVNTYGVFIGCVETKSMRKRRILKKYPPVLNIIYYFFDYILKRVFPKFQLTKKVYFFLTHGRNRVLSKAETLGRLYSCGFEVLETKRNKHLMYFAVRKIGKPVYDPNPTYGPLVKLRRVGKNGNHFYVFKMRTMHPFSEYLQDYIYKRFNLKEGGKFNHDFRITTAGRFMRQFWLDELPMLINLVKGDMKIIGVRPLSKHYFNLYSKKLQEKRIKHKPGLIPPFYADLPKTLEEIQESELKYLNAYEKHPFRTDVKYFFKAIFNIIFKRKRSS